MISIITINYKSSDCLFKLVESIKKYHANLDWEIVIINNSPEEINIISKLEKEGRIKIITPNVNLYFAPSINLASTKCRGEYLAFLNVDTYFKDSSLKVLVDFLDQNPKYGAAAGTMCDDSLCNCTQSGNKIPTPFDEIVRNTVFTKIIGHTIFKKRFESYIYSQWDRKTDLDIEAGCDAFLVIRRSVFNEIGRYSQTLLLYLTEEDLGLKLKRANLKMRHLSSAKIVHEWSHSTKKSAKPKIKAIALWDRLHYFSKYHGYIWGSLITTITVLGNPYNLFDIFRIFVQLLKIKKEFVGINKIMNFKLK